MKYIVLSFDDGRRDFMTCALPILKKYRLPATLSIITGFLGREGLPCCRESGGCFMTAAELQSLRDVPECRVEIANHSSDHSNAPASIAQGAAGLRALGFEGPFGIASPHSGIYDGNLADYLPLLAREEAAYIRSGYQIRRDGLAYAALYMLYRATRSKLFFFLYNRRNFIDPQQFDPRRHFLPSVALSADNTMDQLLYLIGRLPDEQAMVINLHSVLPSTPGEGKFYTMAGDFERLCGALRADPSVCTVTTAELVKRCRNPGTQGGRDA